MTDITAGALPADALAADNAEQASRFGIYELERGSLQATLLVVNILMLIGLLAILWTPAVIFWVALALAPTALLVVLGITLGWWL